MCSGCSHAYFENPITGVEVVFFNSDKEALVIERGIDPWKGQYAVVGGFLEIGESLEDCAKRESEEEVGVTPDMYGELQYVDSRALD